ncbi:unnamed protein product [Mytilus coruscus]|uniref:Uncharacterized protein n=1 Tax=Mytilus coruscus TaxID=42192 RepID=A0A6J8DXH2_MYTCO|nr:unnamed protein product [Mytilus coruscus]
MKTKNAKYHNLGRIKFNNTNLERAKKRHMSPIPSGSSSECKSPKRLSSTPRSKDQQHEQPDPVENANSEESVVFRSTDLPNLYEERLTELGSSSAQVHSTRLKDKLMQKMPELEAHRKGRDVLLMFEKDKGPAIAFACDYIDTMHMEKTAEMIRCQLATKKTFSGSFVFEDIDDSLPPPLLQLVKMIEHGPDIKSQFDNVSTTSDLALAQLLMFNYHSNTQKVPVQHRHSAYRETPFCA